MAALTRNAIAQGEDFLGWSRGTRRFIKYQGWLANELILRGVENIARIEEENPLFNGPELEAE